MVTLQETSKCWHCNCAVNGLLVIEDVSSGWETSSWVPASVTGWRMIARAGFSGHLIYRTCSEWSLPATVQISMAFLLSLLIADESKVGGNPLDDLYRIVLYMKKKTFLNSSMFHRQWSPCSHCNFIFSH